MESSMPHLNAGRADHPESGQEHQTPDTAAEAGAMMTTRRWLAEWFVSIAAGFLIFLFIRTFALEAFRIPTGSMENTLLAGDFVLVNKAIFGTRIPFTSVHVPGWTQPHRGDVIVFIPPHEPDKNYVKRLIALPGDTVEMREKFVFVNGHLLSEPYAQYSDFSDASTPGSAWQCSYMLHVKDEPCNPSRDNWGPLRVPPDDYLVLGDNRDDSEDSRYWGFVGRESIRGRPLVVYFSMSEASIGHASLRSRIRWGRLGHEVQ
jgi:signal peptidase I